MLENWLMPELNENSNDYIFQKDGTGKEDDALLRWPPRSPDLTPFYSFFWGFVKDTVFVPPLPANIQILA